MVYEYGHEFMRWEGGLFMVIDGSFWGWEVCAERQPFHRIERYD